MQHKDVERTWVWCSDCVKKENPNAICKNCYLRYEEKKK